MQACAVANFTVRMHVNGNFQACARARGRLTSQYEDCGQGATNTRLQPAAGSDDLFKLSVRMHAYRLPTNKNTPQGEARAKLLLQGRPQTRPSGTVRARLPESSWPAPPEAPPHARPSQTRAAPAALHTDDYEQAGVPRQLDSYCYSSKRRRRCGVASTVPLCPGSRAPMCGMYVCTCMHMRAGPARPSSHTRAQHAEPLRRPCIHAQASNKVPQHHRLSRHIGQDRKACAGSSSRVMPCRISC